MALGTYTELQAAIASWLHRDPGVIPDLIALAEKRINSDLVSRLSEVESTLTGTVGSRTIALPTGFISPRALWLTSYGTRIPIEYVPPERLPVVVSSNGQPIYYTVDGETIAFDYPQSAAYTYTFRYKKGFDLAGTSTNHVLTNYPALYLFSALLEGADFSESPAQMDRWAMKYQDALEKALSTETENRTLATLTFDSALVGDTSSIVSGGL